MQNKSREEKGYNREGETAHYCDASVDVANNESREKQVAPNIMRKENRCNRKG